MGQPGRKPLPGNVHQLRGNPSKLPLSRLADGMLRPDVSVPKAPDHMGEEARSEWRRITKHLQRLGIISQLDRAHLTAYCDAWGEYVWAQRRIAELNADDPTGERGRIAMTASGYKTISAVLVVRNKAMEQMARHAAEFGLSPSARSRVTTSDRQPSLPGMDKPQEGGWASFE